MHREMDRIHGILEKDVDPDFLESCAIAAAWAYHSLYERLKSESGLTDEMRLGLFAQERSSMVVNALSSVAHRMRVPYDFKRLACNGQRKLLIKMGRVVMIQEPILMLDDAPRAADYKTELADANGLIRQLELDLGDDPKRSIDWNGQVFAVFLHGSYGAKFSRRDRALGGLMLAVPNAHYDSWVTRIDLRQAAMFGRTADEHAARSAVHPEQEDRVVVKVKTSTKKNTGTV